MDPLGTSGDYHFPLHALTRKVLAAVALHDRIEGHPWLIGDRPRQAIAEDAEGLNASRVSLGNLYGAAAEAVCCQCGRELGRYLKEVGP